jgi:hypothetical protein
MKREHKIKLYIMTALIHAITIIIILVLYAKAGHIEDGFITLIPVFVTAVVCTILYKKVQ